jgi:hypothetical protein
MAEIASLLPTTKKKPSVNLWDHAILIYGQKLIGKSTLAAEIPDNIFLNTGGGLDALEVYQVPIPKWEVFINVSAELIKGDHPFKVVTIDTIDRLHKLAVNFICKKLEIVHPGDLDFGKAWDMIKDEMMRPLMALALSPMGLILISHVKVIELKTRTGTITKSITTLQDHMWQLVESMSGIILFYTSEATQDGEKRVLRARPSENWIAGDRTKILAEYGDVEMLNDGKNWERLQKIFSGETKKGA